MPFVGPLLEMTMLNAVEFFFNLIHFYLYLLELTLYKTIPACYINLTYLSSYRQLISYTRS